jgi:hypothetical protein
MGASRVTSPRTLAPSSDGTSHERSGHEAGPAAGQVARTTEPRNITKKSAQKISPGESEDLPELSAGSDEPEDLPDPTPARYPSRPRVVNGGPARKTRSERIFVWSSPDYSGRLNGNVRSPS